VGRRTVLAVLWVTLSIFAVACSSGGPAGGSSTPSSASDPSLHYLALGDSWPEGAHCGGCRTFAGLYADGLAPLTGRHIEFKDLTGSAQPYFDTDGGGSASLLKALRSDSTLRDAAAAAEVIMIATGPNEAEIAFEPYKAGTCGGADHLACFRTLDGLWHRNFDAILQEIELRRAGKPTAIRLVSAANPFLSDPSMAKGLEKDFATTKGALIFKDLSDALCDNAKKHHAVCVDVRPVLNGSTLDQPVDENSPASMRAVADALLATKLPEL
jgi:hypothetical protein